MRALLKTANANMYRGGDRKQLQRSPREQESRSMEGMVDQAKQKVRKTTYPITGAMLGSLAGAGIRTQMGEGGYEEAPLLPVIAGAVGGFQGGKYYEQATR